MGRLHVVGPEDRVPIEVGSFASDPVLQAKCLGSIAAGRVLLSDRYWKFSGDQHREMSFAISKLMNGIMARTLEFRGIDTDVMDSEHDFFETSESASYLTLVTQRRIGMLEAGYMTDRLIEATNLHLSGLYFPYQLPYDNRTPDQPPNAS